MRFALSEDQVALRDAVRELLARECPPTAVRAAWPGGDPSTLDALWAKLAGMGLTGAAVPEAAGGLGLSDVDMVPLFEETGRVALPLPAVETIAVAGPLLAATGDAHGLLAALVDGELTAAAELTGSTLIPHAQRADVLLWRTGDRIVLAERAAVEIEAVSSVDGSRALGRVGAGPVRVVTDDPQLVRAAWQRGVLATAAQLLGLAARQLDMTVEYVRTREQFGVPVGSFQAVKHQLATALLGLRFARPAVLRAGYSLAAGAAEAGRDVAMAKALASEAAEVVTRTAIQAHGAIAYTVEYDLHLFAKRVWALSPGWGSAEEHRAEIATALGLPGAGVTPPAADRGPVTVHNGME